MSAAVSSHHTYLRAALAAAECGATAPELLQGLVQSGLDRLPQPGAGETLARWQALASVAEHDLSLAKLYEGHTDALAILEELQDPVAQVHGNTWGVWAAESPQGRVTLTPAGNDRVLLHGAKCWCSGAAHLSHGLLTAWRSDDKRPQLVRVAMAKVGVHVDATQWRAVGMAGSASIDVVFDGALAHCVGDPGDYLARPGFWHGGAGVAACWYGGALALARALHQANARVPTAARCPLRLAAVGKVDVALQSTSAVLRETAQWMDAHPYQDAAAVALRVRLAAEACATRVLDEAGRALGAAAFCRDAHFARMAADLPVFVRQSHAERDFAALAQHVLKAEGGNWSL